MSKLAMAMQRWVDERNGRVPQKTKQAETREKHATKVAVIARVRAQVFILDSSCICGRCPPRDHDHCHEIIYRSKTRGRPPEERFSTTNCVRLSDACHRAVHDKMLTIATLESTGANGMIKLARDGREWFYTRKA